MKLNLPVKSNSSQVIATLDQEQAEDRPCNSKIGSLLSHIISQPRSIDDITDVDSFVSFTESRFSTAYLAEKYNQLLVWGDLEYFDQLYAKEFPRVPPSEQRNKGLSRDFGLNHKIVNSRVRRPAWVKDDWQLAQQTIGTPALIAQMQWRHNMDAPEIAEALGMKPSAVQKAITRMGNDVSRLGLRNGFLVGGSISRGEFAHEALKAQGMSNRDIAAHFVKKWFGEHAVNRYKVAVMYWQWNMTAIEIAEELEMSLGAVEQVIYRLQGEGE